MKQQEQVTTFFDRQAAGYRLKYSERQPYLRHVFKERIRLATAALPLRNCSVLDIGAGTGALYEHLEGRLDAGRYYACDISAGMLAHSRIPEHQRFTGTVTDLPRPEKPFDYIFLLGVTTYMEKEELRRTLAFIEEHLSAKGKAVLSFTNRRSLDFRLRRLFRPLIRRSGRGVAGQAFPVQAYKEEQINPLLPPGLTIADVKYFNFVIPPFEKLSPHLSVRLSRYFTAEALSPPLQRFLLADFLVFLEKQNGRLLT